MKKVLAAAGIGAAVTIGSMMGAGTANAIPDGYNTWGGYLCHAMDDYGYSGVFLGTNVMVAHEGYSEEQAGRALAGAIAHDCPWHAPTVQEAIRIYNQGGQDWES